MLLQVLDDRIPFTNFLLFVIYPVPSRDSGISQEKIQSKGMMYDEVSISQCSARWFFSLTDHREGISFAASLRKPGPADFFEPCMPVVCVMKRKFWSIACLKIQWPPVKWHETYFANLVNIKRYAFPCMPVLGKGEYLYLFLIRSTQVGKKPLWL